MGARQNLAFYYNRKYLPVVNSDGDIWKISVAEDKVSKKHLEQPQEDYHKHGGSENKSKINEWK